MAGMKKSGMAKKAEEAKDAVAEKDKDNEEEGSEKSHLAEDELNKALDLLEGAARTETDEREALLKKALDGDISEEENARLIAIMSGGDKAEKPTLAKSVTKSMQPEADQRLQKSLDVSDYLDGLHAGLVEALDTLSEHIEKSDNRQHSFNIVLAKGVRAIGELVKSLDSRIQKVEQQPVGGPKAVLSKAQIEQAKALKKSFAGQGTEERLSKSQVISTLQHMEMESLEKGRGGKAVCGEDFTMAIAKYETTQRLSRPMLEELMSFRKRQAA